MNGAVLMSSVAPNSTASIGTTTNQTADTRYNHDGEFWAGAGIDTVLRAEALPSRTFYDFEGKTVKDSIKALGNAGLNALRIQIFRDECLGPESFVNSAISLSDEPNFKLDIGRTAKLKQI
ncbi:MAG: hypothetical protein LQ343_000233 [Gyalolechia ehrenbergii]|nr:MAG: hypothetical protein LQ343_000233 [Gyalolechia ehrenbergii]